MSGWLFLERGNEKHTLKVSQWHRFGLDGTIAATTTTTHDCRVRASAHGGMRCLKAITSRRVHTVVVVIVRFATVIFILVISVVALPALSELLSGRAGRGRWRRGRSLHESSRESVDECEQEQ